MTRVMRSVSADTEPADLRPDDLLTVKVVAVIGWAHDFACYAGPADWTDEDVARRGDKLGAGAAWQMFGRLFGVRHYRE